MVRVLLLFFILAMNSVVMAGGAETDPGAGPFGAIPTQRAESGKRWQWRLRVPTRNGVSGTVTASHLPQGARLRTVDEQWLALEWQPALTQSGLYSLTLTAHFDIEPPSRAHQVVEVIVSGEQKPVRLRPTRVQPRYQRSNHARGEQTDKASRRERQPDGKLQPVLQVDRMPSESDPAMLREAIEQTMAMIYLQGLNATLLPEARARRSSASGSGTRSTDSLASLAGLATVTPVTEVEPVLARMATRIVSVGRIVSLDLRPVFADGQVATVQVDRLPRNATFEQNPDGSRSFYWPTAHRDQGEHRFRFTARHPDDVSRSSQSDLVIIVGDPSQGGSVPQPALQRIEPVSDLPSRPTVADQQGLQTINAEASDASDDPFSERFDPALDNDLAPELDDFGMDDNWEEPG